MPATAPDPLTLHFLDRTHPRADSRMDALARTHTRTRIDMWPLATFVPFSWEFYIIINFCCHQYPLPLRLWPYRHLLVCHAATVSTRHRSPAPVLQHLVPATHPIHLVAIKPSHQHRDTYLRFRHAPAAPLILLSVYLPPVASTVTVILFSESLLLCSRLLASRLDSLLLLARFACVTSQPHSFFRVVLWSNVTLWLMVLFRRV